MKKAALAVCFLVLASCDVFPSRLRDLALEGVTFIPLGAAIHLQTQQPPDPKSAYLRIVVSSSQNLVAKSDAGELNIYPMVVECQRRERELFAYGPYLDGMDVSQGRLDGDHPQRPMLRSAQRPRFSYEILLPVTGKARIEDNQGGSYHPYDLIQEQRPVCLRIGGGNMLGGHFRSNELRLNLNFVRPSE